MPKPVKTLTSISVNSSACQTHYFAGDYFNPSGAVVTAHYSNGTSAVVYSYIWGPQTALTTSDTYVSFSYTEGGVTRSANVAITVSPATAPVSLSVTGTPVRQYAGEAFDAYGLTVVIYRHNGGSSQLTPSQCAISVNGVIGGTLAASSTNIIAFSYQEGGDAVSATMQLAASALPSFSGGPDAHEWRGSDLSACLSVPLCDFNPEGYPFSLSLEYQSVQTAAQRALSPELPGGWGLSARAQIAQDCGTYKYYDAAGRVLSFSAFSGGYAYSLGPGTEVLRSLQGGGYEMETEDGAKSSFSSDGRLTSVSRFGSSNGLALCLSYDASGRLSEIYYSHASGTKMAFVYGNSGYLSKVEYRSGQTVVASVSLSYDASGRPSAVRDDVGSAPANRILLSYDASGTPRLIRDARSKKGVRLSYTDARIGGLTSVARRLSRVEEGVGDENAFTVLADRCRDSVRTSSGEVRELVVESRLFGGSQWRTSSERFVFFQGGGLSHSLPVVLGETYPSGEDLGVAVPGLSGSASLFESFAGRTVLRCPGSSSALVVSQSDPDQGTVGILAPFRAASDFSVTFQLTAHVRVNAVKDVLVLSLSVNGRQYKAFLDTRLQGSFQPVRIGFRLLQQESAVPSMALSLSDEAGSPVEYDLGDPRLYPGPEDSLKLGGASVFGLTTASLPSGGAPVWMTTLDAVRSMRDLASSAARSRILYACGGSRKFFYPASTPPTFPVAGSAAVALLSPLEAESSTVAVDLSGLSPRTVSLTSSASTDFSLAPGKFFASMVHTSSKTGQTLTQTYSAEAVYDAYLRPVSKEETLDSTTWKTLYQYDRGRRTKAYRHTSAGDLVLENNSYDSLGRPTLVSDADRAGKMAYGSDGRPRKSTPRDVASDGTFSDSAPETYFDHDAFGRLTGVAFGDPQSSPVEHSVAYDSRGETSSIRADGGPGWSAKWVNYPTTLRSVPLPSGSESLWEKEDHEHGLDSYTSQSAGSDYIGVSRDDLRRPSVLRYSSDDAEKILFTYNGPASGLLLSSSAYYGQAVQNGFDAGGGPSSSTRTNYGQAVFAELLPRHRTPYFSLLDAPATVSSPQPAPIVSPPAAADSVEARCALCGTELPRFTTYYGRDGYGRTCSLHRSEWGSSSKWGEEIEYLQRGQTPSSLPSGIAVFLGGSQAAYSESVTYDARSRVHSSTMMGVTHNYDYDGDGRLSSWSAWRSGTCLYSATYSYDGSGNLEHDGPSNNRSQFSYDAVGGRLVSVSAGGPGSPAQSAVSYAYSSSGKRSSKTVSSVETTYEYFGNRLLSVTVGTAYASYPRDERGRPIRRVASVGMGPSVEYHWSDDNRLIALTRAVSGGTEVLAYFYDMRGPSGFVRYLCSESAGLQVRSGFVYCHFVRNTLGDVLGVCAENQSGGASEIASYVYDPWGLPVESTEDPGYPFLELNPFRYRGYFYDRHANLYLLGARAYDPASRCFLEPDDAMFLDPTAPCGVLRYAYCYNNPLAYVDYTGHIATGVIVGLIIGALIGIGTGLGVAAYFDYENDGALFNWGEGDPRWYDYAGAGFVGALIGGALGAVIGWFAGLSWTIALPSLNLTHGGAVVIPLSITVAGTDILAGVAGLGLFGGSIMFSKHNPGMSNRPPRSWVGKDEGIDAMKRFNGNANKAAEYIMNNHQTVWHKGAGTDFNAIKKWLDRIISKLLGL